MSPIHDEWPDVDGTAVGLGDWIEVWCTWTDEPKFEGRSVQVVDVLSGGGQTVFRLRDPGGDSAHHYMPASSRGFRKVSLARESGIRLRVDEELVAAPAARKRNAS